jgi:ribosomal protein L27
MYAKASSMKDSEDEFEIETPTAIMGVRGTNLFVGVNPGTGQSTFFIASGVGQVKKSKKGKENTSNPSVLLYPAQQININEDTSEDDLDSYANITDIDSLVGQSGPAVIEAIIKNKQAIDKENEEYLKNLKEQNEGQPKFQDDFDRIQQNLDNLVGNIVNGAIEKNKVNPNQIQDLINQVNQQIDKKLDLNSVKPLELTEQERQKQEQLKRLEEQRKQKQAEEKKKQEELKKQNEALLKKLEEQKKKQQEENQKRQEEAKKKAEEALKAKLEAAARPALDQAIQAIKAEKEAQEAAKNTVAVDTSIGSSSGSSNTAPVVANPLPNMLENLAMATYVISLSDVFSDSNSDSLTYTAISNDDSIAAVSVIDNELQITKAEESTGTVTITVTAQDGRGGSASTSFDITFAYPTLSGTTATAVGTSYITLDWVSLDAAVTYVLSLNDVVIMNTEMSDVTLYNLEASTSYTIRIVAIENGTGLTVAESVLEVSTAAIGTIGSFEVLATTPSSITVTWDTYLDKDVKLYLNSGLYSIINTENFTNPPQYIFNGLDPSTSYEITMEAIETLPNESETLWATSTIIVETDAQVLDPPLTVEFDPVDGNNAVPTDSVIVITFSTEVALSSESPLTNDNVAGFIDFNNSAGSEVIFTAAVVHDGLVTVITLIPVSLDIGQTYYVAITSNLSGDEIVDSETLQKFISGDKEINFTTVNNDAILIN